MNDQPKTKEEIERELNSRFEESYYNAHTDLLRYSGFPALNGTQLDRLRVGVTRMVTTLRAQIKIETKTICTALQKATITGFLKVGEDMMKQEEEIKELKKRLDVLEGNKQP